MFTAIGARENEMLLELQNVTKTYWSGVMRNKSFHAVKNVNLEIGEREIFGIIGESGSGKTTTCKIIMGLLKPTSGTVLYKGEDITQFGKAKWHELRKSIQMIFQHPQMTFNPRSTVYSACAEPIRIYKLAKDAEEEREMVLGILDRVGVSRDQLEKYPHEISGGQAQRLSIARTLLLKPSLLICDEPTSMLDISVQAQILSLLKEIHGKENLTLLYISHNLDVVASICDRIAVMKDGEIVEMGNTAEVFSHPKHAYTKHLLSARI